MSMIKGTFIILLFLLLGEIISLAIEGYLPGNVLGMILLFVALQWKLVGADDIRKITKLLTGNMALFFVPAAVGLMASAALIAQNWLAILVSSVVSTMLVLAVVGVIQQKIGKDGKVDQQ